MLRLLLRGHLPGIVILPLLLGPAAGQPAEPPLSVQNYPEGTILRYPVPLLMGDLADRGQTELVVVNKSSDRPTRELKGQVLNGRFKALTELVPGRNDLVLRAGDDELPFMLHYKPQTTPYVVRMIYLTDDSGDTTYQTQLDDDPQDYATKLDTAMKLMQTFIAERMHALGFGRTTFNLEYDAEGKVRVHTVKADHPAEHYDAMGSEAWFKHLHGWLGKEFSTETGMNVVIPAFTRFDPETRKVRGHTALGGGGLALFGSGGLFTWPSSLADVGRTFQDPRPTDVDRVQDDSNGRQTIWGTASTGIGATLHELGHAFGLFHCKDRWGIMTRGFDHFGRTFTFVDPPSGWNAATLEFSEGQVARLAPMSGAGLKALRWFAMDARDWAESGGPRVSNDAQSGELVIESDHGIRFVGFDRPPDTVTFTPFLNTPDPPRRAGFRWDQLRQIIGSGKMRLRVIDEQGFILMPEVEFPEAPAAAEPQEQEATSP